jgi:hypothetical protein
MALAAAGIAVLFLFSISTIPFILIAWMSCSFLITSAWSFSTYRRKKIPAKLSALKRQKSIENEIQIKEPLPETFTKSNKKALNLIHLPGFVKLIC